MRSSVTLFFFSCYAATRALHSFPTRRSSDLQAYSLLKNEPMANLATAELKQAVGLGGLVPGEDVVILHQEDRKSTRLNSSHVKISYAVFCLKKKKKSDDQHPLPDQGNTSVAS